MHSLPRDTENCLQRECIHMGKSEMRHVLYVMLGMSVYLEMQAQERDPALHSNIHTYGSDGASSPDSHNLPVGHYLPRQASCVCIYIQHPIAIKRFFSFSFHSSGAYTSMLFLRLLSDS